MPCTVIDHSSSLTIKVTMDYFRPSHSQQSLSQQATPSEESTDLITSQTEESPPRKRRKSGKGNKTPKSRVSNACDTCRQRKTKCSGPPGPCTVCKKAEIVCVFHPSPESRRKCERSSHAMLKTLKAIMEKLCLILKHNKMEDLLTFIQLIRGHAPMEEILARLKADPESLQRHESLNIQDINDADLIALMPRCLSDNQGDGGRSPLDECPKQGSPTARSWTTDLDTLNLDYDLTAGIFPDGNVMAASDGLVTWNIVCNYPAYQNSNNLLESLSADGDASLSPLSPLLATERNATASQTLDVAARSALAATEGSFGRQIIIDKDCRSISMSSSLGVSIKAASVGLTNSGLESALDRSILSFVDCARQQISTGVTLEELNEFGKADCELLFRDRIDQDALTIPNWACEEARRFRYLLPEMRISLALCLMRFVAFLICPSAKTLQAVPGMLRPTDLQERVAHRIEYDFVPIPKLRNCLIDRPTEWISQLGVHKCRIGWSGIFGDVGGAKLSMAGNWTCDPLVVVIEQLRPEVVHTGAEKAKIIVRDTDTGRCYISQRFEEACWNFQNWIIDRSVLKVWPELHGHIRVK